MDIHENPKPSAQEVGAEFDAQFESVLNGTASSENAPQIAKNFWDAISPEHEILPQKGEQATEEEFMRSLMVEEPSQTSLESAHPGTETSALKTAAPTHGTSTVNPAASSSQTGFPPAQTELPSIGSATADRSAHGVRSEDTHSIGASALSPLAPVAASPQKPSTDQTKSGPRTPAKKPATKLQPAKIPPTEPYVLLSTVLNEIKVTGSPEMELLIFQGLESGKPTVRACPLEQAMPEPHHMQDFVIEYAKRDALLIVLGIFKFMPLQDLTASHFEAWLKHTQATRRSQAAS